MPYSALMGRASLPHWSVRQFLVCLLLVALLPGVLGALGLLRWQYHQSRTQLDRDSMQSARALAQAVDSSILRAEAVAQTLALAESLRADDLPAFHRLARATIDRTGLKFSVIVLTTDGRQLLNTFVPYGAPLPRSVVPDDIQRVVSTRRTVISNLLYGPVMRRHGVTVNVPVVHAGAVRYVLAIALEARQFDALYHQWQMPSDWIIAILDRTGTVIDRSQNPDRLIGKKAVPVVLDAILRQTEGIIESQSLDGTPVFTYFSRAPYSQWTVGIGVMRSSVLLGLRRPLTALGFGVVALFAVGLVLAWLMGGRIAASVKALILPAFALGEGRAVGFAPLHVREALQVAEAIGRAQHVLAERQAALEAREHELSEAHRLARFGTWVWNLGTGRVETSRTVPDVLGCPTRAFDASCGAHLFGESWPEVLSAAQRTGETGEGFELQVHTRNLRGADVWLRMRCEGVRAGAGSAAVLHGSIQDVTEEVEYEEALRESERAARRAARRAEAQRRRLDAVLEAAPVGIIVVAVGGEVLQVNAAHRRLWGPDRPDRRSSDWLRRRGWWADGPRQGQPLAADDWPLARALDGVPAPRSLIEIETLDYPPLRRIALVTAAPVRDEGGALLAAVGAQLDVSERVRAERRLLQADRRKDEFLAMLAHELRNPLAPIAAAAEILCAGGVAPQFLERTSVIIARQVRHLAALVEDLLDVSRVTRGLVTLERVRVDLNRMVTEALAEAHARLESRSHHVTVHSTCRPAEVSGDPQRLKQVLVNLLDNAAKFTPPGGRIEIELRCEPARHGEPRTAPGDGVVVLTIQDNGPGIVPELLPSVFDLFTQGERSLDRAQGGLGIGLALVKSLVEMHGGSVSAHSGGTGQGSCFAVRLPALAPVAIDAREGGPDRCGPDGRAEAQHCASAGTPPDGISRRAIA